MTNQQIRVTMLEWNTNKEVVRMIDINNFAVPDFNADEGWECNVITTDEAKQKELLEQWIADRATSQHNSPLDLISWEII